MDDNKINKDQNQPPPSQNSTPISVEPVSEPQPIFESVPVAEEVAPEVTSAAPEEINQESGLPPDMPPPVYEDNKSKYFVVIGGVIVFFLLLIIFFKFVFSGKGATGNITLTYWGLWEDKTIFDPLIQQYQQQNPGIKIDYQEMSPQEYRDKLLARSKNGQGPDIFRFHNTWLPEIKELASPIPANIMSNAEFEKTFYKVAQQDLKVGDYYYGLPLEIDGLVLIYNDSLLKKAGISAPPATWDDLTNDVNKLTVRDSSGNLITAAIAMGTTGNVEHFGDIFSLLLTQNGGNITKLDAQEAAGALEIYRKFAEPQQAFWNDNMPDSLTAFIQEKVAMIIAPSWDVLSIKAANPDITVKVAPVPAVPGAPAISIANYWVEGVSRFSKNQLAAWKFLRFLVEKDSLTRLYENESKVKLFGEPYSRVDLASLLIQNEYVGPVMKEAGNFVSVPAINRTYDNGLDDQIVQYIENAINSAAQGVSYSEALKTAKAGVDQVFNQYGK